MYMAWQQHDVPLFVTTTADTSNGTTTSTYNLRANQGADNAISLREAVAAANATRNVNGITDEIQFAISGSGSHQITLGSAISISDGVTIDGTTQSGWVQQSYLPSSSMETMASTMRSRSVPRFGNNAALGMVIRDFQSDAIDVQAANTTIAGNWIGQFNSDGSDPGNSEANLAAAVRILNANNVTIGGRQPPIAT